MVFQIQSWSLLHRPHGISTFYFIISIWCSLPITCVTCIHWEFLLRAYKENPSTAWVRRVGISTLTCLTCSASNWSRSLQSNRTNRNCAIKLSGVFRSWQVATSLAHSSPLSGKCDISWLHSGVSSSSVLIHKRWSQSHNSHDDHKIGSAHHLRPWYALLPHLPSRNDKSNIAPERLPSKRQRHALQTPWRRIRSGPSFSGRLSAQNQC